MNFVYTPLLRRKNQVCLFTSLKTGSANDTKMDRHRLTGLMNLVSIGYAPSGELYKALINIENTSDFDEAIEQIKMALMERDGITHKYRLFYPDFPDTIMNMDEYEIYSNAIFHYWTDGIFMPQVLESCTVLPRQKYITLELVSEEVVQEFVQNLLKSPTSLSEQDKDDIKEAFDFGLKLSLNDAFAYPYRENKIWFLGFITSKREVPAIIAAKHLGNLTDILRYAAALSDADISLSSAPHFRKFTRRERRLLLALIELYYEDGNTNVEMWRYREYWLRLGEILHPGEYATRYPKAAQRFEQLRNGVKPESYLGTLESVIKEGDWNTAIEQMRRRPAEFARRLDFILRNAFGYTRTILSAFAQIVDSLETPFMLQLRQHFINRREDNELRVFYPKGTVGKIYAIPETRNVIDLDTCDKVINILDCALLKRFNTTKKSWINRKVYIDSELKGYLIPFGQRSASASIKTMIRGSSIAIREDSKVICPYIWWTNNSSGERCDIDLSVVYYDKDWRPIDFISWQDLKNGYSCHSGDIINGGAVDGEGVAEMISIKLNELPEYIKYVVFHVSNYADDSFEKMENCQFGWMEYADDCTEAYSYNPDNVRQRIDLRSAGNSVIPMIYDVEKRVFVWADLIGTPSKYRTVLNDMHRTTLSCYAITHTKKANLKDLIILNMFGREAEPTNDINEADYVFTAESIEDKREGVEYHTYDEFDYIVGELM